MSFAAQADTIAGRQVRPRIPPCARVLARPPRAHGHHHHMVAVGALVCCAAVCLPLLPKPPHGCSPPHKHALTRISALAPPRPPPQYKVKDMAEAVSGVDGAEGDAFGARITASMPFSGHLAGEWDAPFHHAALRTRAHARTVVVMALPVRLRGLINPLPPIRARGRPCTVSMHACTHASKPTATTRARPPQTHHTNATRLLAPAAAAPVASAPLPGGPSSMYACTQLRLHARAGCMSAQYAGNGGEASFAQSHHDWGRANCTVHAASLL